MEGALGLSHDPSGWLKTKAPLNIQQLMSVTPEVYVSHDPSGWLKAEAPSNMLSMVVTLEVSHGPSGGCHTIVSSWLF